MNVSYHESRILASLADSMLDAIVIVDWHGTILFANRAAAGLVGLTTADEGIGMNMLHFIHPDWRSSVIEDLHLIKEGKRGFETDYRLYHLITKQKEKKWVEAIGTIVNYKGDTADLVTMRDVTDRKKAEDLLIRERQAFSIITDASLKELTVPAMVRHILTGLTEIIEFDYGIVRLYNESDDTLHVVSTVGIGDELPADVFPPVSLDNAHVIAASVALKREPIFAPDIRHHPVFTTHRKRIDELGIMSTMSWPMVGSDNRLLGVIHLMAKTPRDFGAPDRSFFETVAGTFSLVLERRKINDELQRAEKKYRTIFENATIGIFQTTAEGKFISANQAVARIHGFDSVEDLMESVTNTAQDIYVDPSRRNEYRRLLEEQGHVEDFEIEGYRKDGSRHWFALTAHTVRNADGATDYFEGTVRSITKRKRAEEALMKSEEKYRTIFETTGTSTAIIEEDTTIPLVNTQFEILTGYTKEEIEGKMSWTQFVAPQYLEIMREYHRRRRRDATSTPRTYEYQLIDRSGVIKDISAVVDMIPGTPQSIVSSIDISEQKRTESLLKKSEERYRAIFETTRAATIIYGEDTLIQMANTELANLFGYPKEEIEGKKSWTEFIVPEDLPRMLSYHRKRLSNDVSVPKKYEFRFRNRFGAIKDIYLTMDIISGTDLRVGSMLDVTDMKRLESQLQRARKMEALGTLAGGVAHDLNNVLGGLVSYPELLLMQIPDNSPLRKPITTIQKSGQKAAAIVQDLLTLARRGVSAMEVTNLNHLLSEYLKSPEHEKLLYYHPGLSIETRLADELLNVDGSPTHLSKTIMNLISNAAESMPDGGTIVISTENRYIDQPIGGYDDANEGEYAVLTVSDTGIGIKADDMERIFEPFYTKKVMGRSGTGLGMAVVWGTVKDHGGYIDLQSTEGAGTTFTLYFPATRKEIVSSRGDRDMSRYRGHGETILVVDDVREQREIAAQMLEGLGYTVSTVPSGEQAVTFLKDRTVDLVILDMIMDPGLDGLETYRQIYAIHPQQKAIIVSGFSETGRVKKLQKLGVAQYVRKPFLMEKLAMAVRKELDRSQGAP